jgi:hypothetical protein
MSVTGQQQAVTTDRLWPIVLKIDQGFHRSKVRA